MKQSPNLNEIIAELKIRKLDLSDQKFKASMGIKSDTITTWGNCILYNFYSDGFIADYRLTTAVFSLDEYDNIIRT